MSATPTAAAAPEVERLLWLLWGCNLGRRVILLSLWLERNRVGRLAHPGSPLVFGRYQGGPARVHDPGEGPIVGAMMLPRGEGNEPGKNFLSIVRVVRALFPLGEGNFRGRMPPMWGKTPNGARRNHHKNPDPTYRKSPGKRLAHPGSPLVFGLYRSRQAGSGSRPRRGTNCKGAMAPRRRRNEVD